jgi:hypothetical protein
MLNYQQRPDINFSLLLMLIRERGESGSAITGIPIWVPAVGGVASLGFLVLEII